jgi:hypothetical protein
MNSKKIFVGVILLVSIAIIQASDVSLHSSRLIPKLMNYQGYLTDTLEVPIDDSLDMTFRIFDAATSGTELWSETKTNVAVERGVFSALLGETSAIPDSVFEATDRWLELTIEGTQTLSPRTRITSVGYAYTSTYSDTAEYARNADADSDWTVTDSVLYTGTYWGLARGGAGNVLYGDSAHSHVNFGVACTTGTSGQDYRSVTVTGGQHNVARGAFSTIAGGHQNNAYYGYSFIGGGKSNWIVASYGAIVGGLENEVSGPYAAVVGGYHNHANYEYGFIGGGYDNEINDAVSYGVISGGYSNDLFGSYSFVGGGAYNYVPGEGSVVSGGTANEVSGNYAVVCGGDYNDASGDRSFVGSGDGNYASGDWSILVGGTENVSSGSYAIVGGGDHNYATGNSSVVVGGSSNSVQGSYSAILGGYSSTISGGANYSYLFGINSSLTQDSTFMVDMPHIRFGDETNGYEFPAQDGSADQVMVTDGSGQLSWSDFPSDTDWTISGSDMYSGISGNVGIGTSTPGQKLDIQGNIAVSGTVDGVDISVLQSDLSSETAARIAADNALDAAIITEETARIAADNSLQSDIDDNTTDIAANTTNISTLQTGLAAEQAARAAVDASLQEDIDAEQAARTAADNALQAALDTEEAARIATDNGLQAAIDAEQASRTAADNALDAAIITEETARIAADNALQSDIDDNASDIAALQITDPLDYDDKTDLENAVADGFNIATSSGNVGIGTNTPARTLHVNDVIRLTPRANPPTSAAMGDMYIDSDDGKLYVYDGSVWQACW